MAASQTMIAGVAVPSWAASVVWGQKYEWENIWVLATKRGKVIARFSSEAELDAWWKALQESRGREPKPLENGTSPIKPLAKSPHGHDVSTDYYRPWSEKYDMPEIDFE